MQSLRGFILLDAIIGLVIATVLIDMSVRTIYSHLTQSELILSKITGQFILLDRKAQYIATKQKQDDHRIMVSGTEYKVRFDQNRIIVSSGSSSQSLCLE